MIQDFLKADDDAEEEDDDDDEDETFDADGGSDDASDADEGSGQILFPIRNPRTKNILDDSDDYSSIDESDSGSEEELGSSEESGKDWDELEAEAMRDDKNKERDVSFCYIFKTHPTLLTIFSVTNEETETEEAMEVARNENMEGEACQVQRNKDDKMFQNKIRSSTY